MPADVTANFQCVVGALPSFFRFMFEPGNRDAVVRIILDTTRSAEDIARQTLSLYCEPDRGVRYRLETSE